MYKYDGLDPRASNLNQSYNEFQVYFEMKRSGATKKWIVVKGKLDLTTYKITKYSDLTIVD